MEKGNKNGSRACYACRYFRRYYIKGKVDFSSTKFGMCYEHKQSVSSAGSCDDFERRRKGNNDRQLIENRLDNLFWHITSLRFILENDNEENM